TRRKDGEVTSTNSPKLDPLATADSQETLNSEIQDINNTYEQGVQADTTQEETQTRLNYPPYRSSLLPHPTKDLHHTDPETIEWYIPAFGNLDVHQLESELTIQHNGEPIGERIVIRGGLLDGHGRTKRKQLIEVSQANAAGRYIQKRDQHPAPI